MGLLFHADLPHSTSDTHLALGPLSEARAVSLRTAIKVQLLGGAHLVPHLFTTDVVCTAPHAVLRSVEEVAEASASTDESFSAAELILRSFQDDGDLVSAEWTIEATFSGALLLADDLLIEPTGARVSLAGATFASYRGDHISNIRYYYDDSELLAQITRPARYRRWLTVHQE